ncbi:MAG: ribosome silencing factor [Bacillota bacterium]
MAKVNKELKILNNLIEGIDDKKGLDIVALDLQGISLVADYFIICHGNSDIQVQAIATELKKRAIANGLPVKGIEGMNSARWVLMDFGDYVAHIFHKDERGYYNLERLWSDAKRVNLG